MPSHPREIRPETATRLRGLGFTGVTVIVPDPLTARREEYERAGSAAVTGSAATVNLTFLLLRYPIVFRESGLPAGSDWQVVVSGVTNRSAGDTAQTLIPGPAPGLSPGRLLVRSPGVSDKFPGGTKCL